MTQQRRDEVEAQLLSYLDDAATLQVGMAEDDSQYTLNFISEKLALASLYQERLGDLGMKIARLSIEVRRASGAAQSLLKLKHRQFKGSVDYQDLPRDEKSLWLEDQLSDYQEDHEGWKLLQSMVSEVKEAVADQANVVKRIDSDLRLHSKLYEQKVAAGATSPDSYTGNNTDEIEI